MSVSEQVAQKYLIEKGVQASFFHSSSPDFRGDAQFEVKRAYRDKYGQRHIVLGRTQFLQIRKNYPLTSFLFVDGEEVSEIPLRAVSPDQEYITDLLTGKKFIIHWQPRDYTIISTVSIKFDDEEEKRIQTIKALTGLKSTTEVVRVALMEKYKRVVGSPNPIGGV